MPIFGSGKQAQNPVGLRATWRGDTSQTQFKQKSVITWGYVAGGYKDSVAWANVNKFNMNTDICTNLADLLQSSINYCAGAHTADIAYLFGGPATAGQWGNLGVGAWTASLSFNMRNDTTSTKPTAVSTYTMGDTGVVMEMDANGNGTNAYVNGNISAAYIQKFNIASFSFTSSIASTLTQSGSGSSAYYNQTSGTWWSDDAPSATTVGKKKFTFSSQTESSYAASFIPANYGNQKGLVSKNNYGYAGSNGSYNGGFTFAKLQQVTDTIESSTVLKPYNDGMGEENWVCGMDWGVVLGEYNGAQNNRSGRFNYQTEVGYEFGASGQPSGKQSPSGSTANGLGGNVDIAGRSSAHGFWRTA